MAFLGRIHVTLACQKTETYGDIFKQLPSELGRNDRKLWHVRQNKEALEGRRSDSVIWLCFVNVVLAPLVMHVVLVPCFKMEISVLCSIHACTHRHTHTGAAQGDILLPECCCYLKLAAGKCLDFCQWYPWTWARLPLSPSLSIYPSSLVSSLLCTHILFISPSSHFPLSDSGSRCPPRLSPLLVSLLVPSCRLPLSCTRMNSIHSMFQVPSPSVAW